MRSHFLFLLPISVSVFAQHDMHEHHDEADTMKMEEHHHIHETDTMEMENHHHDEDEMEMSSYFSNNLPMNRDGSGTSWQPDATPMFMHMIMKGNTSFMVHGTIFLRYNMQDINNQSKRGGNKFDAPNMFMCMLSKKPNEKNLFSLLAMLSLDPLTVGKEGYSLLFQTGESYHGIPLVDKQHPHDLFSELALNYTHSFSKDMDVNTYFGYPGEPALGPTVFMHRASALNDPNAPLGHHWQDASHITFGVATLGFRYGKIKAEGSIFTGREPDENRYNFETPTFDSYSYRLSANPNKNFSLQFSQGFIKSPEALIPDENIVRTTASITHSASAGTDNFVSTSLVGGINTLENKNLYSVLLESNLKLKPLSVYARYEFVQKDKQELQILSMDGNPTYNIQALTLGINKEIFPNYIAYVSAGIQGTINFPDEKLKSIYGNNPFSAEVYLKISPPPGHMHHH